MNKEITIYELLGLIKDGQAPKHIKFRNEEWWWGYDTYTYFSDLLNTPDNQFSMFSKYIINYCLNDKVGIIEEDREINKIKGLNNVGNSKDLGEFKDKQHLNNHILKDKINELIDEINKLKEEK